ncbi:MAG: threonine--tRNA ligase, partial [Chlorobi bacterium]|nr:threonine--tRNA ligase [Chlorobiota bacterium]
MIITLPNGEKREYPDGSTGFDIAKSISDGLARMALGIVVNGQQYDMSRPINEDADVQIATFDHPVGKEIFRHSSAHVMAEAIQVLYPGVKFGIGPHIDNGFYYDIELPEGKSISVDDLPAIENKMKELIKTKSTFERVDVSWEEAVKYFTEIGDEYKLELLDGLKGEGITLYKHGNFTDLCRGAHIPNTSVLKSIKLLSVAGAYWRGDADRQMMTRIYGTSFPKKKLLDEYLVLLEEAKKRDHRKLGKELELFTFSQAVGAGLPMWLPKGAVLRDQLEKFLKGVQKEFGYEQVITPHIGNVNLYKTSGHFQKYAADSYQTITTPFEGEEFMLKPMNCPHHCEIYKSKPRSYRDLPVRMAEFGTVYRYEQSGELHGLTRVRSFTQDDAHIFCLPDQLKDEFKSVIDIVFRIFNALDFNDFTTQISLRDPEDHDKYIGSDENWEKSEKAIVEACEEKGL